MTTKFVNSVKAIVVFLFVLSSILACEKDFENIGVNIVDNNLFNTAFEDFDLIANTKNVEFSRVDNLPRHILGVYRDNNFGKLEASFVSQLTYPGSIDFGLDPEIDTVIVDIPYFAVLQEDLNDNNTPKFQLDSIYGNVDNTFQLRVQRLSTFLNTLDPTNPSLNKIYYSNESYNFNDLLASYDNFKFDVTDTALYVKRPLLDDIDTIKTTPLAPSLKLSLDSDKIRDIFIDNPSSSDLATFENFNNYFRGIIIEAIENNDGGSIGTLNTTQATFTIYFTNTVLTDETETDLNGDGDLDDKEVPVITKQSLVFPLQSIDASIYNRDYTNSVIQSKFNNPDENTGQEELFIQGAGGSMIEIDIFKNVDLDELRNKNWLINGAILDVYVREGQSDIPNRLYLYNLDNNSVITDVITEARVTGIDGNIDLDDDENPTKYRFLITDYISQILDSSEDRLEPSRLAMKTYHSTDLTVNALDTIVRDFSWNPRGVIVHGSKVSTVTTEDKKMKLRIYYTEDSNN